MPQVCKHSSRGAIEKCIIMGEGIRFRLSQLIIGMWKGESSGFLAGEVNSPTTVSDASSSAKKLGIPSKYDISGFFL